MTQIDVVIPTVTGREDSLARCMRSYQQTAPDCNLIVVWDHPTVGIAWKKGMAEATAPYVHLSCDDLEVSEEGWAEACIRKVDEGKLPAPIIWTPGGTLESCGGRLGSGDGDLEREMQEDGAETDFTVVPFMSAEQAERIGMIDAHYLADTYVSYRGRQLGIPTVVTHEYEFVHHWEQVGRRSITEEDRKLFDEALK